MMNSKALRNGFALMETMMALTIIGFLLTSLLILQGNVLRRVVNNTQRIEHFYPVEQLMITTLMHPLKKGETRLEKRVDDLGLTLVYEQKELPGNSSLARFKGLYRRRAQGTWLQEGRGEQLQELIGFGFSPPPSPEKKV